MQKYPPYSASLKSLIAKGYRPKNDVNLFVGLNAWQKGASFSVMYPDRTLILPPWLSPADFLWPVMQCDIIIFDSSYDPAPEDYIDDLVWHLYKSGANAIRFVNSKSDVSIYHKDMCL